MFRFFADQALTTPLTRLSMVTLLSAASADPVAAVVYFGSPDPAVTLVAAMGGEIAVFVASGGDLPSSAVRLASNEADLAAATGGDALSIGTSLSGGASGAVAVWLAVDADAVGRHSISLRTSEVIGNG